MLFLSLTVLVMFQSTPPHEGRPPIRYLLCGEYGVSIHAPTRGATFRYWCRFYCCPVSIHAPTRGATLSRHVFFQSVVVSIHAPTRGATYHPTRQESPQTFQSTPPHEGRHEHHSTLLLVFVVSIHAPTRGATNYHYKSGRQTLSFNPRPHARGDSNLLATPSASVLFQSTPPREGRLSKIWTALSCL